MKKILVTTEMKIDGTKNCGHWMSLADYSNSEEFLKACHELHADEPQPELRFLDWDDAAPHNFIQFTYIDELTWDWLKLSPEHQTVVQGYRGHIDGYASIETALECFSGKFESIEDWAVNFWDETGMQDEVPEFARGYIDYEKYANDARMSGDMIFLQDGGSIWAYRRI